MRPKDKTKASNKKKYSSWGGLLRDIIFIIAVIVVYVSISQLALGLWSPMVAVESGSMIPHIEVGDIILVQSIDRTQIITYETGKNINYTSYGEYGDVILYKPNGMEGVTPIIHRAMYYVEQGEPMWQGGPPAPHAGYITKGDHECSNPYYDQMALFEGGRIIQPVKKEWVIGVARFYRIPLLGYVSIIPRNPGILFQPSPCNP